MKKYKITFVWAAFFFIPVVAIQAQSTFAPDRPGLGDGSHVAQKGALYIELGARYYEGGVVDQFNLGQIMLRYGVMPNVELRLSLNSFVIETSSAANKSGLSDPSLGVKFYLYHNAESSLTLSGLASVTIPTGYTSFTGNSWIPSAALIADYQLSGHWSINANLGYTLNPGAGPDQLMFTFTPGFTIGDSNYGAYFGYAAFLTSAEDQHFIEAGITRVIGKDLQLDINGGIDVSSGDVFVGAGIALRF